VTSSSFLTSHARVLLCIARDPGARLRDIAASLDITERSARGIVTDLTAAGYVIKHKDGRRNRYQVQAHLPLPEPPPANPPAIAELLAPLAGPPASTGPGRAECPARRDADSQQAIPDLAYRSAVRVHLEVAVRPLSGCRIRTMRQLGRR